MSRTECRKQLSSVRSECGRAMAEVSALPSGNGFATQEEMRRTVSELYLARIAALERMVTNAR